MEIEDILELEKKQDSFLLSLFASELRNLCSENKNRNFILLNSSEKGMKYYFLTEEQIVQCKKILDILSSDDEPFAKEKSKGNWVIGKE